MERIKLETLVEEGKSIRQIAEELNRPYSTTAYNLRKFGLVTRSKAVNTLTKRFETIGVKKIRDVVSREFSVQIF